MIFIFPATGRIVEDLQQPPPLYFRFEDFDDEVVAFSSARDFVHISEQFLRDKKMRALLDHDNVLLFGVRKP